MGIIRHGAIIGRIKGKSSKDWTECCAAPPDTKVMIKPNVNM